MAEKIECTKCGEKNIDIAKNLKCSKCGTEYVYSKEHDCYFWKYIKCAKCKQESGTITSQYVCDKCGTKYVYDAIGASIFVRKEGFIPENSLGYWAVVTYYSGFWAKAACVILGTALGIAFILEGEGIFFWLGWIGLLIAAVCAYLLFKAYKKDGIKGFFGIKEAKLSKKGMEIKKKAEEKAK